jgi:xanthine/CO dehydrogenase XdhC/CoxF family maturation factor
MNELQAILNAFEASQKNGETTFLATVVSTKGSTYRRRGAKMLITNAGQMVGMVSGGCLENDIYQHTRYSMPSGAPIVITYDTTADEDIVWGFGLGCNGVVQVLLEKLDDDKFNPLRFISQCFTQKHLGATATIFGTQGEVNAKIGNRLMLNIDGKITCNIADINLNSAVLADAQTALQNQHYTVKKYQLSSGIAEVFIDIIHPPTPLMIFGAGRDAVPVVNFAKALGWHVTIVDCRASLATRLRFPLADQMLLTRRETLRQQVSVDEHTVVVIMTHNYLDDLEILKMLLPSPVPYIGALGSKERTERLLRDLHKEEIYYTEDQENRLYAPVGIDIGSETPEEIAIAIIAEIQAVLANRSGGFLKNRQGSIHQ